MSTKTMKKGHGVAAAVALIAAVFTLSVNAATWFTEKATTFNAEGYGTWTASEGATLTDIVQVGDTSLAIDADGAELTYTPATAATGDVQTVTLKVCFSAAYDDLTALEKPQGGFGLVAYDNGEKTVYAVYNGKEWEATDVEVTDVETATHTITITTDGTNVTYKEGEATIDEIPSVKDFKPTSFSFKGTGVLHDEFTGEYTVLAVEFTMPTIENATITADKESPVAPGTEVTFTVKPNDGFLFADGTAEKMFTQAITAAGEITIPQDVDVRTAAVIAKIGDKEYVSLSAAFADAAAATDSAKTVTLVGDVEEAVTFAMTTKNVILDLNGKTLTGNVAVSAPAGSALVFTIKNPAGDDYAAGKVVGDITVTNGKLTVSRSSTQNVTVVGSIVLTDVADATIQGAIIQESTDKAAITVNGSTLLKVTNVATIDAAGTAIDAKAGTVKILSNSSTSTSVIKGDVVAADGVTMSVTGGKFTSDPSAIVSDGYVAVQGEDGFWNIVKMVEPTATVTGISAEGYEAAVQFDAGNIGVGYDKWTAKFYLTSDVTIGEGEIQLGGNYGTYGWVDKDFTCEANEPVSVLAAVGLEDDISVKTVFDVIQSFKCGVKNIALKNDATFSLKLVITDGETTKEICSIDNLVVAAADIVPTAEVLKIEDVDHEAAVKFDAGNIGVGYDNWTAKFYLTSDVTIGEGEVKLGGNYGEYGWVDKDFTCTADEPVSVLAAVGLDDDISVKTVFDVIQSFKCGVKNIALKNDATFTLKLVITDGETTKEICSIGDLTVAKKQAAYPENWPTTDPETQAKFATWAADKGAGADLTTPAAQEAFLLNCSLKELPAEEAAFKITAFTGVRDSIATPTTNLNGEAYNGTIVNKAFSDVTCKTEVEPDDQAALFFKAFLTFPAAE